jgi:inorganic pyrophosphatase
MNHCTFWSKLDDILSSSEIVIDRPKGSHHPRFHEIIYPLDYGYLKKTKSSDGAEIDIWIGSLKNKATDAIICTVDNLKKDSEIKVLVGCTESEKKQILSFLNNSEFMGATILRRPKERT